MNFHFTSLRGKFLISARVGEVGTFWMFAQGKDDGGL